MTGDGRAPRPTRRRPSRGRAEGGEPGRRGVCRGDPRCAARPRRRTLRHRAVWRSPRRPRRSGMWPGPRGGTGSDRPTSGRTRFRTAALRWARRPVSARPRERGVESRDARCECQLSASSPPIGFVIGHIAIDPLPPCMCAIMWLIMPLCIFIMPACRALRCAASSVTTTAVAVVFSAPEAAFMLVTRASSRSSPVVSSASHGWVVAAPIEVVLSCWQPARSDARDWSHQLGQMVDTTGLAATRSAISQPAVRNESNLPAGDAAITAPEGWSRILPRLREVPRARRRYRREP